jgi:hypothetical protein
MLPTSGALTEYNRLTSLSVSGNIGDHALLKGNLLDLARHVAEVNQQAVDLCHPDQRVLF